MGDRSRQDGQRPQVGTGAAALPWELCAASEETEVKALLLGRKGQRRSLWFAATCSSMGVTPRGHSTP